MTSSVPWALITSPGSGIGAALAGALANVRTSVGLKIVFAQDVHGPLHPTLLSNAADYQASLQRLIDLEADVLCEGNSGIDRKKGGRGPLRPLVHAAGQRSVLIDSRCSPHPIGIAPASSSSCIPIG